MSYSNYGCYYLTILLHDIYLPPLEGRRVQSERQASQGVGTDAYGSFKNGSNGMYPAVVMSLFLSQIIVSITALSTVPQ